MALKGILTVVVILIVCYVVYDLFIKSHKEATLTRMQDARESHAIKASDYPKNTSTDFTYSMWLYVNDWNYRYGENKVILRRVTSNAGIAVALTPELNNLQVLLAVYPSKASHVGSGMKLHKCWINNIPLQAWTNIIVSVNNRAMDLYLDGKLVRTCIMPGVPRLAKGIGAEITPDGGFSGFVSTVKYFAYSVNPSQAYDIYKDGYGGGSSLGNLFNKYRIKLSFVENNKEVNSFEL